MLSKIMPSVQPSMTWTLMWHPTWQLTCLMTWHFFLQHLGPGPLVICYWIHEFWNWAAAMSIMMNWKRKIKEKCWHEIIILYTSQIHIPYVHHREYIFHPLYTSLIFFSRIYTSLVTIT